VEISFFEKLISSSVELAILFAVLFGMYRLTLRVIDVLSGHVERCCESLERIADALETRRK